MSQVIRKYETGGKSPQEPELFEWKDVNKYNKADLIAGLAENTDTYIRRNNLSGDKANQFRQSANQFIEGIKNGTVTMNRDGTFTDVSGTMGSTGKYDRKFLGMGTKNNENNAFNRVGDFVSSYIRGMSPYKVQTEAKEPATKATPLPVRQRIANTAMGGAWSDNVWRKFTPQERLGFLKQTFQNMHNDFVNNPEAEFNKDVFGTRENWIERSSNLLKGLEDNKYDPEDLKYSAAMGYGDLSEYLNDPTEDGVEGTAGGSNVDLLDAYRQSLIAEAKNKGLFGEEAINAYVEKGLREQATREQEVIDSNENELKTLSTRQAFEEYKKANPFQASLQGAYSKVSPYANIQDSVAKYLAENKVPAQEYLQRNLSRSKFTPENAQHIVNNLAYVNAVYGDKLVDVGGGFKAIPTTYDYDKYSTIVYNPTTQQYKEMSMLDNPELEKLAFSHYEAKASGKQPQPTAPPRPSRGAGQKFQQGGVIFDDDTNLRYYQHKQQANKEQVNQTATATGRSAEQVKGDTTPHTSFSAADKMRMGALAGDVASLIASMSGVGSVASAGIGAASTGMNQAADMMEGQSFGQAFWNNAGSYALDALSLIPFAKAAKVPKMIKAVGRFAPIMTTALAAYQGVSNWEDYKNTWGKVGKGESLSVSDWRNILNSLQLVAGGTAATHRAAKAKSNVAAAKSADTVWMKTPQGWRKVDAGIANKVQSATSIDAQNKLLKDSNIQLEEARSWGGFGKGKGVANVKTTPFYDFNKPVTTYSGDLPLEHTFGPGERFLGTAQMPDIHIPGVRNAYNRIVHPKAYKKAKGKSQSGSNTSSTPNKPTTPLALPAPNQVTPGVRGSFGYTATTGRHLNDFTDPSKLSKPGSYTDRAVRVGGSPVEAPSGAAVRTVAGINNAVNAIPPVKNLPVVLPASRNAKKVVAANTKNPTMDTKTLIESRLPKRPLSGAAKKNVEKTYRNTFEPIAEREYNQVWDEAVKGKFDFGYEDVTPRRSIYTPPVGTEITATPNTITDKNARYLWELVNPPKRSTAHVKREPPKKQTKPKTKKKSKDDRVTKKAIGGTLIPRFQNGKVVTKRNVKSASDLNWNTDIAGSQGFRDTLAGITPANASKYNSMQNTYATLGFGDTKPGNINLPYNQKVADYQGNFDNMTTINDNTMAGLAKSGRIVGRGGSSDKGVKWTPDGLPGDQTWLRHLGKRGADITSMNQELNPNGMEAVINYNNGMVNYMPVLKNAGLPTQSQILDTLTSPVPAMGANLTKDQIRTAKRGIKRDAALAKKEAAKGTVIGAGSRGKGTRGFNVLPEDVIALGRMVGGLATNNRAAEQYKAGLKPLLIDTYENTVPVQGNLFAKMSADKQASELTSLAGRPRTSDGSLQLAGELEANNRAGQMKFQGDMMDAQEFYRTRALSQAESDAAKARRVDVGNRNRASMLQINAAKAQIDSAKTTANYQQVVNPYLAGIENQFRQNRAAKKQYETESYRQGLLAQVQPQYDAAVKAGDTAKAEQLLKKYNADMLSYSKDNVGMPWMFQRKTPTFDSSNAYTYKSYAKGGRLSAQDKMVIQRAKDFNKRMLQDNKQFHKDIMEAKKVHASLIKSMSSLTSALIKKGMSWK